MTHPTQAPNKERPFLPRINDGGILARFGDTHTQFLRKMSEF